MPVEECSPMTAIGVMLDCSRNSVMTVTRAKLWLRRLALLGYNWVMFYTKDIYEIKGEEFFGYLRGRYTLEELREIDNYASKLGIRITGCIQTLAHLEPALRWPAYSEIRDTASVLMTQNEKSYQLIGKMLDFFSAALKDRRLHIGMDEAFDLGRGQYMNQNGYQDPALLYLEHIKKVAAMCRVRGIRPMIWSDMFLRQGSKNKNYYDPEMRIPESARAGKPDNVDLIYWDYYHTDEQFYTDWINHHRKIGGDPIMASSIWVTKSFWYRHELSRITCTPCVRACIQEKITEIFFALWEDDGAYGDRDSALAGLTWAGDLIYAGGKDPDENNTTLRFSAVCLADYKLHIAVSEMINTALKFETNASDFLWDDPLLGICWKYWWKKNPQTLLELQAGFSRLSKKLSDCPPGCAGDIRHLTKVSAALSAKMEAQIKLYNGYFSKFQNIKINDVIRFTEIALEAMKNLLASYRVFWYERAKTFGFEVIQIRIGSQCLRHEELIARLGEVRDNKIDVIPELEQQAVNFPAWYQKNEEYYKPICTWRHLATPAFDL
ncbi:MAG TPA: hypothetical protein DC049_19695 [Spirochaetia bacterium]|nr:hypothetical protein [Spirochaetia bacterium]